MRLKCEQNCLFTALWFRIPFDKKNGLDTRLENSSGWSQKTCFLQHHSSHNVRSILSAVTHGPNVCPLFYAHTQDESDAAGLNLLGISAFLALTTKELRGAEARLLCLHESQLLEQSSVVNELKVLHSTYQAEYSNWLPLKCIGIYTYLPHRWGLFLTGTRRMFELSASFCCNDKLKIERNRWYAPNIAQQGILPCISINYGFQSADSWQSLWEIFAAYEWSLQKMLFPCCCPTIIPGCNNRNVSKAL